MAWQKKTHDNKFQEMRIEPGSVTRLKRLRFGAKKAMNNMVFSFCVFFPLTASRFTFCVVFTALLFPPASVRGWTINCTASRANILVALQVCKGHVQTTT